MARFISLFKFPRYEFVSAHDTETHEKEHGTIKAGGRVYTVYLFRPKNDEELPFLVTDIFCDGKLIWTFNVSGWDGYTRLAWADTELVIALLARGRTGKLQAVCALEDIMTGVSPGMKRVIERKEETAKFLDRDVAFTKNEQKAQSVFAQRRLAADKEAEEAKALERARRREQRRQEILARVRITAYTALGAKCFGIPIVSDEWEGLEDGTYVIRVESLGANPIPKEAFIVGKSANGRPRKINARDVFTKKESEKEKMILPIGSDLFVHGDDLVEVAFYESMENIRKAQAQGLNSGARVAVQTPARKTEVFKVTKDKISSLGVLERA